VLPTPTSFRPESLVGTTLDGRFQLTAHIASGGMGAIFRAEHVYMKKELALKVLRPDLSTLPDIAERFRREAEIAASLEDDNIVRVMDFGRSPEGWLFLAMELLDGESLFERLRRGAVAPEQAIYILLQMCRGLEAAHARGVVHRDLKPENIFLLTQPRDQVKILDFGIAKLTDPQIASDTQTGVVVGTPEYLSPEQATGTAIDGRADLYAVGLIGWRMLAGFHPFHADDARGLLMMQATRPVPPLVEARPELVAWPGLLSAIARACSKEPCERHIDAAELRAELETCLGPAQTPTHGSGALSLPARVAAARARALPNGRALPNANVEETLTLQPGEAPAPPPPRQRQKNPLAVLLRPRVLVAALLLAAAAAAVPLSLRAMRWLDERPVAQARTLLATNHPEAARDILASAVLRRPTDPRLRILQGHAQHRIPGEAAAGIESYVAAFELDPLTLDAAVFTDLAGDLARDRKVAARAAELLVRAGARAVPSVIAATHVENGPARLKALEVARELGAENRIDAPKVYGALLREDDCDVRRAAARRLGELGNSAAVPDLMQLAHATRKIKGLFGLPQQVPVCGAVEADAALQRIEKPSEPAIKIPTYDGASHGRP
jgi:serine/threonine-protein kinase